MTASASRRATPEPMDERDAKITGLEARIDELELIVARDMLLGPGSHDIPPAEIRRRAQLLIDAVLCGAPADSGIGVCRRAKGHDGAHLAGGDQ